MSTKITVFLNCFGTFFETITKTTIDSSQQISDFVYKTLISRVDCHGKKKQLNYLTSMEPMCGICVLTPFSEMAAHIVILAPRWPSVSVVALCPIRLRPRLQPLDRLNPALSKKTRMWVVSCLEFSKCFLFLWVSKTSCNTGILEVQ